VNLQGLAHGRVGGGSGRKKMQMTFQGSPSVTLRESVKSPDASEIEAKLQEIMKLTDILTIDGKVKTQPVYNTKNMKTNILFS
jgi:hypothetical protein